MALLDDVKKVLRISNTAFDVEISDLIDVCKLDLGISGTVKVVDTDKLIKQAITTYVKANFGWDNPDAERLQESYNMMKNTITLSSDYAYFKVIFTVTDGVNTVREATVKFNSETKTTGADGTAIFYALADNNYKYTISADGYITDNDDDNLIDIIASDATVNITLVGA